MNDYKKLKQVKRQNQLFKNSKEDIKIAIGLLVVGSNFKERSRGKSLGMPDCNRHHRIKLKQRFDILFEKDNYEILKHNP